LTIPSPPPLPPPPNEEMNFGDKCGVFFVSSLKFKSFLNFGGHFRKNLIFFGRKHNLFGFYLERD
jgi:hypothetical protein